MTDQLRFLGPVDTAFLYVETPETPMNIGAVTIFDGPIPFDDFVKLVDSRIHQAPIYQQRIVQAPLSLGQPAWIFDPDFYVENHVFQAKVDSPGTDDQLRELVGGLISSPLERNKPLWEIYLIEGLSGNRTAVFFKVHHCMVDGLAAVELFTLLFDFVPDTNPPSGQKPLYDPPRLPGRTRLLTNSAKGDLPFKFKMLKKITQETLELSALMTDKEKRRRALYGIANLVNDNLKPIRKLAINGTNSGKMMLAWAEFSLAEVRAIKSSLRASVNDVMLTVYATAIEKYLKERRGGTGRQEFLRVIVPVSMRVDEEKGDYGNRISIMTVDVPFEDISPLERLRKVTEYATVMKESSLSTMADLILTLPALAPAASQPLIWSVAPKAFSFIAHSWCTNVMGPQIPIYLLGQQMLHTFGYFPLNPTMGLSCVITSYNQRISMTLVTDAGIVPDITELQKYLQQAYLELRKAAKVLPAEPIAIATPKSEPIFDPLPEPVMAVMEHSVEAPASENGAERVAVHAVPEAILVAAPAHIMDTEAAVEAVSPQPVAAAMAAEAKPKPAPVVEAVVEAKPSAKDEKRALFSESWAQAFQDKLNSSDAYFHASTKWEAGSLALVIKPSDHPNFRKGAAVWLDLYKGKCRVAQSLPPREAQQKADFVVESDYATWLHALEGHTPPLMLIMRGKLRLAKGSMRKLLPFTHSAQELVHCAQEID